MKIYQLKDGDTLTITKQNGVITIALPDDAAAPVTTPSSDPGTTTPPVTTPPVTTPPVTTPPVTTPPVTTPPVTTPPDTTTPPVTTTPPTSTDYSGYSLIDDLVQKLKTPVKLGTIVPSGGNEYGLVEDGNAHLVSDNKGQAVYRKAANYEALATTFGKEGKILGLYRYPGVVPYNGAYYGSGWGQDGKVVVKKGRYPDTAFLSPVLNTLTGGGFTKYDQDIQPYPGGFVCTFKGDYESGNTGVAKNAYIMTAPTPAGPWTNPVKVFPVKNPLIGGEETDPHFAYFRGKGYVFIGSGLLASNPQKQVLAGAEIDMKTLQAKTAPVVLRIPALDWETKDANGGLREAIFNPTLLITPDAAYFSYTQNAELPPGSDQSKPSNMGYVKIPLNSGEYTRTARSRTPVDFNFTFDGTIKDTQGNAEAFTVKLGGGDPGTVKFNGGLDMTAQDAYLQIDRHIDAADIDLTIDAVLNYPKTDNPLVNLMTQNKQEEAIGHRNSIFLQFAGINGLGNIEFATNEGYATWPVTFQISGTCRLRFVYANGKVECWYNDKSLGVKPVTGRFQVSCVGCELPAGKNAVPKIILKGLKIKVSDNNGF